MKTIMFFYTIGAGPLHLEKISYNQLMDAIAIVESGRGSRSENIYQLKPIYVDDVCRITGQRITFKQAIDSEEMSRACITAYWDYYGNWFYLTYGRPADASVLARMHNGGPRGWEKNCTVGYWHRVRDVLLVSMKGESHAH